MIRKKHSKKKPFILLILYSDIIITCSCYQSKTLATKFAMNFMRDCNDCSK